LLQLIRGDQLSPKELENYIELREANSPEVGGWSSKDLTQHWHARPRQVFLGRNQQNEWLGAILSQYNGEATEVLYLETLPGHRRQGVMTRLFELFLKDVERGSVWLEVNEHNRAALALYKKMGFQKVGERPNYYGDGGAAILLTRIHG
jgi:[ribosomal protein S18]-alanine N-acetyltransferase